MKASFIGAVIASLIGFVSSAGAQDMRERPGWAHHFADRGVTGTIVVVDERPNGGRFAHDAGRARTRFSPASTFKIPHALFALDSGVVRDEFQVFPWDGQRRWMESWNRDQTLRDSMRNSTVWVYQLFARRIGEARERDYLRRIGYGDADASGGVDRFWLDGELRISAVEQIGFLQRLYRNELPFRVEHQRLVKDVLINEAGRNWILRAKTGWSAREGADLGWWVGWVERPEGAVFFALNIDMPRGSEDTGKRMEVGRTILSELGALPAR